MKIANSPVSAREFRAKASRPVVLVPTMGALHEGHAALIRCARKLAGAREPWSFLSVCQSHPVWSQRGFLEISAFLEAAIWMFAGRAGADLVFRPSVEQMYRGDHSVFVEESFSFATFVRRLTAGPFSRCVHRRREVVPDCSPRYCHLRRKGLAAACDHSKNGARSRFSDSNCWSSHGSRARRSGDEFAQRLPDARGTHCRSGHLCCPDARRRLQRESVDILKRGRRRIEQIPGTRIDYLELVDAETIEPARSFSRPMRLAVAVFLGKARLIDNIAMPREPDLTSASEILLSPS